MTSIRVRPRRHVGAFLAVCTLGVAAGCATAPESPGKTVSRDEAVPAVECARLSDEIALTEHARSVAGEQSGDAWKAVVPVVVLARKASGMAAVREADSKLAALKVQARRCEPS